MPGVSSLRVLRNDSSGWLMVVVAAMLWGSDVLLRPKALAGGLDSVAIVLVEHAALFLLFLPVLFVNRREIGKIEAKEWTALLFISWAGSSLATVLLTKAYEAGSPLTATLLQKLQPIFAVALAGPMLGERRKGSFWIFFGLGLAGGYLLSSNQGGLPEPLGRRSLMAGTYAVGAATLWGACTVVGRWALARLNPFAVAGLRFTLALPLLLVWALAGRHLPSGGSLSPSSVLWPLLLIVLLPDSLGMLLYYLGLDRTNASAATLAEQAYPVTAMLISFDVLIKLNTLQWVGIVLLMVSPFLVQRGHLVESAPKLPAAEVSAPVETTAARVSKR